MSNYESTHFLVIRHGANAANQSMLQRQVLGIVEAEDIHEARKLANDSWTVYNNQRLEIQTTEEASEEEWLLGQQSNEERFENSI